MLLYSITYVQCYPKLELLLRLLRVQVLLQV